MNPPTPSRGRPEIGDPVLVRIQPELLAELDARVAALGISRAEWIRQAIQMRLDAEVRP